MAKYIPGIRIAFLCLFILFVGISKQASLRSGSKKDCPDHPPILCPNKTYYAHNSKSCEPCSKCEGSLVEKQACGEVVCGYQFDTVCCHDYEYAVFDVCILDCNRCQGGQRCESHDGAVTCICPPGRCGILCEKSCLDLSNITNSSDSITHKLKCYINN